MHPISPRLVAVLAVVSLAVLMSLHASVPSVLAPEEVPAVGGSEPSPVLQTVPVSSGASVTIWEHTGSLQEHTFLVSDIMAGAANFSTRAAISEEYSITSDGTSLAVYCYKVPPFPMEGIGTGNNIVAVRLDGVSGFPNGLYASVIVGYSVGVGGVEESRFNALGPETQLGPYMDLTYTSMGDYGSELVLGFAGTAVGAVQGTLDFDPDTLNLGSNGKWVTCLIELPDGYDVSAIVFSELTLNDVVPADTTHKASVGDADSDGVPDLVVKFDRASVQAVLTPGPDQLVWVSGELESGDSYTASDLITVLAGH